MAFYLSIQDFRLSQRIVQDKTGYRHVSFGKCCVTHPGSRIQDPKTSKKRGVKKIICHTFFCSQTFNKIENYFIFEMPKKEIWPSFRRIIELFTQKFVSKLLKLYVWDPGSGINLFRILEPGPGVKKAPDPGSRSATQALDINKLEGSQT
jgi:hypothetical protein